MPVTPEVNNETPENTPDFSRATKYGGQSVTKDEMEQIRNFPIGRFLDFQKQKDGNYRMKYCMPESAQVDGKTIQIRKSINLLTKYWAKACFEKNGMLIKPQIETNYSAWIPENDDENYDACYNVLNALGIPKEDCETIKDFMKSLNTGKEPPEGVLQLFDILGNYSNQIDHLLDFTKLMDTLNGEGRKDEYKKYMDNSAVDYVNEIRYFQKAANMDPGQEKDILGYMECGIFAQLNERIGTMMKLPGVPGDNLKVERLQLKDEQQPLLKEGEQLAFEFHACLTGKLKLNGKDTLISAEMTAPPMGQLVFAPKEGRTATGIFKDNIELGQYHKSKNIIKGNDAEFTSLKNDVFEQESAGRTHAATLYEVRKSIIPPRKVRVDDEVVKTLNKRAEQAKNSRGTFTDSKAYRNFYASLSATADLGNLIYKCQNTNKDFISVAEIKKVSPALAKTLLQISRTAVETGKISLSEANALMRYTVEETRNNGRKYKEYKLKDHSLNPVPGDGMKKLNRDDLGKLMIIEDFLPDEEQTITNVLKDQRQRSRTAAAKTSAISK